MLNRRTKIPGVFLTVLDRSRLRYSRGSSVLLLLFLALKLALVR